MKKISLDELRLLVADGCILQDSINGPKVIRLNNGSCLKFFRLKTWFSSALYFHYADKYIKNAQKLTALGISTTKIKDLYKIPKGYIKNSKLTKAVEYEFLPGQTVRDMILEDNFDDEKVAQLAVFMAKLHNLGVYFRANHLANIVYNTEFPDKLGLIDVENTLFYSKPLNCKERKHNLGQMMRYEIDKNFILKNKNLFINNYAKWYNLAELDSLI